MRGTVFARWIPALALAAAVVLAYLPAFSAGFLWDDDAHITANPAVLRPQGLVEIWTSAKANYSPLTMTSFWAQHRLWGLSPHPYHVVTVLFHAAAAVLLGFVLRQLRVPGAWLGALLWALHPVQVESVAWISELKNTQSAFFFLAAVWWFDRWLQAGPVLAVRRDYLLAVIAAVLAILSKSSTVMLPVVLALVGGWHGRRRWTEAVWLAPFFVVSLAASAWTIWEQKVNSMASGAEWGHGLAARVVIAGKIVWFYLGKLLWPDPLIFIYPRWDVHDLGLAAWGPVGAAVAAGALLWRGRGGWARPWFFGLGYFVVSLFPVLGFFDVFFFRYSFVGDHLQYLASMGPLALAGAGLATAAARIGPGRAWRWAPAALLIAVLGALTWRQAGIYRTNFTLWENTVGLNPRAWIARVNLGVELVAAGRAAEAIPHYETALRLKPQFKEIEVNLGGALLQTGRSAEAIPHFEQALQTNYARADAHNGLGLALFQTGRGADAIAHYEAALQLRPGFDAAHFNLGNALAQANRWPEALTQFAAVVQSAPRSGLYRVALARALVANGRAAEAIPQLHAAVGLNAADLDARALLAALLYQLGRPAEALPHYEALARAWPDSPDAQNNLGSALLQAGRAADALPHYEAALRLRPDNAEAHRNFALALAVSGRLPEAVAQIREALRLQPDDAGARQILTQLEAAARGQEPKK